MAKSWRGDGDDRGASDLGHKHCTGDRYLVDVNVDDGDGHVRDKSDRHDE